MRTKCVGAIMTVVTAVVGWLGPADAAETLSFDLAGIVVDCGERIYQVTSGTLHLAEHSSERVLTVTNGYRHVVLEDVDGDVYALRGAQRFGESRPLTYTGMLSIVEKGEGLVDRARVVFHMSPNGHVVDLDFGTCYPAP